MSPGFDAPSEDRLDELAADLGLSLDDDATADYAALAADAVDAVGDVRHADSFDPGLAPADLAGRGGGYRPDAEEDPLNAWLHKTAVRTSDDGPLAGRSVGLKDSIALAGSPLTLGSNVMEGFVPRIDATVVGRLLDAGAEIAGKLNMESFAWSGRGDLSDYGPVLNPHSPDHLAGGSSSGSGAAPAAGDCDVALGTDQAGSVRIPSSWCGLVGLKPTYGLVPYTGVVGLERTIDHVGPMGPSVDVVARVLDAIAGEDVREGVRLDERQPRGIGGDDYAAAVGADVDGLSVGVLEEGFGWTFSEDAVDETVREAARSLERRGVTVESASAPIHERTLSIWPGIATQGGAHCLLGGGTGTNHRGWAWPRLARVLDSFRTARANDLPPTVVRSLLVAAHLDDAYGVEPYAKARSEAMAARRAYDDLLATYDALVLPTTAMRAFERDAEWDRRDALDREVTTIANTAMFDLTGHPAVSVPCGTRDGLPVGLQLVGAHRDETTLLSLAAALTDD